MAREILLTKKGEKLDRKIIVPTIILGLATLVGVVAYGSQASADDVTQRDTLVEALSQKLNIDKNQVSTAVSEAQDQIRTQRQQEREIQVAANLEKAVADGLITAEQKQKILDKRAELEKTREQQRTEMQKWYSDNGIDESQLRPYLGQGGRGMGGRGMHGMMGN